MAFTQLEIKGFRNLDDVFIYPAIGFNIFYGKNGSGKTSLLEALYYLSFTRSFRTRFLSHIIQHGLDHFFLFAKTDNQQTLGIERYKNGELFVKFNREKIKSIAQLTEIFPVQLINPDIYQLVNEGPKMRRQFLDWGIFYKEHTYFLDSWREIQQILAQRNAALKLQDVRLSKSWDSHLIKLSLRIDEMRRAYLKEFIPVFTELAFRLLNLDVDFITKISLTYEQGWREGDHYQDVLIHSLKRDLQLGYTQYGIHRADLRIEINDHPASEFLSRGQQKLLVSAMKLAQAQLMYDKSQRKCIFLVDDLPSELDEDKRKLLCDLLISLKSQVFVTGIEKIDFEKMFKNIEISKKMFHVKQGQIILSEE